MEASNIDFNTLTHAFAPKTALCSSRAVKRTALSYSRSWSLEQLDQSGGRDFQNFHFRLCGFGFKCIRARNVRKQSREL